MVAIEQGADRRTATRARHATGVTAESGNVLLPGLLLVSLIVPVFFVVAGLRFSPYRLLLFVTVVPMIAMTLSGRAGALRRSDIFVLLHCAWAFLAMLVVHGTAEVPFAGMFIIETAGAYFLGRVMVRSMVQFDRIVTILFCLCLVLIPIAWFEAYTGRALLMELFQPVLPVLSKVYTAGRWGLERAQGPFEHSILYGVFVAAGFSMFLFGMGRKPGGPGGILRSIVAILAVFPSLSAGPFTALMFQIMLSLWDQVANFLKRKWKVFGWLAISSYITVDLLSNRTPFHVFIDYLTFNSGSAYNRILIWRFGTDNVAENPIFGLGLNDWVRPPWMGASVDNFWLLVAMRYGLPAAVTIIMAVVFTLIDVGKAPMTSAKAIGLRKGYLMSMAGMILAMCTVHLWNATHVFFMFLLGAGMWMADAEKPSGDSQAAAPLSTPRRPRAVIGSLDP